MPFRSSGRRLHSPIGRATSVQGAERGFSTRRLRGLRRTSRAGLARGAPGPLGKGCRPESSGHPHRARRWQGVPGPPGPGPPVAATCNADAVNEHGAQCSKANGAPGSRRHGPGRHGTAAQTRQSTRRPAHCAPLASGSSSNAGCGCWPAWGPASRRSGPSGANRRG